MDNALKDEYTKVKALLSLSKGDCVAIGRQTHAIVKAVLLARFVNAAFPSDKASVRT